jgi:hypothetical protein
MDLIGGTVIDVHDDATFDVKLSWEASGNERDYQSYERVHLARPSLPTLAGDLRGKSVEIRVQKRDGYRRLIGMFSCVS